VLIDSHFSIPALFYMLYQTIIQTCKLSSHRRFSRWSFELCAILTFCQRVVIVEVPLGTTRWTKNYLNRFSCICTSRWATFILVVWYLAIAKI